VFKGLVGKSYYLYQAVQLRRNSCQECANIGAEAQGACLKELVIMSKLQLRYFPDPVLRQKTKKVTHFDTSVRKLAQDMLDTMYASDGVGLAAPQVGVSKRLMVIDVAPSGQPRQPIVFINPVLLETSGEMVGLEGCLSFPDVFFEVTRFSRIVVKYQNLAGKEQKLVVEGNLLCRAIQHEIDHLDGLLFVDKPAFKLAADLELTKHGFLDGDVRELEEQLALSSKSKQAVQAPMVG
jgi:peptide deformylase